MFSKCQVSALVGCLCLKDRDRPTSTLPLRFTFRCGQQTGISSGNRLHFAVKEAKQKNGVVAQTFLSAVSRNSSSAGLVPVPRLRNFRTARKVGKPAKQQVWKPALRRAVTGRLIRFAAAKHWAVIGIGGGPNRCGSPGGPLPMSL